jgi:hypothetical protein
MSLNQQLCVLCCSLCDGSGAQKHHAGTAPGVGLCLWSVLVQCLFTTMPCVHIHGLLALTPSQLSKKCKLNLHISWHPGELQKNQRKNKDLSRQTAENTVGSSCRTSATRCCLPSRLASSSGASLRRANLRGSALV